ncbi:flagellar protein FliT [Piscibacillus salipiscarius]|uniref:Flagellar protein FliT n=1 Tax=Piscibacillus salipiscarius TaxID=299480 RepID=A0ABW5QBI8_9BACI
MSEVKELFSITQQMVHKFRRSNHSDREELIKVFENFVENRDRLMKDIDPPYTDEEKQLGQEIIKLDEELKVLVIKYLGSIQQDISVMSKKKLSNKKYINPYASLYGIDGSYIDKRN